MPSSAGYAVACSAAASASVVAAEAVVEHRGRPVGDADPDALAALLGALRGRAGQPGRLVLAAAQRREPERAVAAARLLPVASIAACTSSTSDPAAASSPAKNSR